MTGYIFHIGINERVYRDYEITDAPDLDTAKALLLDDMAENTCLHIFAVSYKGPDGTPVKEDIDEDHELPDEKLAREINERRLLEPYVDVVLTLRDLLLEVASLVEKDQQDAIAETCRAADQLIMDHLKELEPVMNYAVVGRADGDVGASTLLYNGTTKSDAIERFRSDMKPAGVSLSTRELEGNDFDGVWVDAVIESETPLSIE